jgi:hypothetical protein
MLFFGIGAPFYVFFPMWLYARCIRPLKNGSLKEVESRLALLELAPENAIEASAFRSQIAYINGIPIVPFRWPKLAFWTLFYAVTLVGTIASIYTLL